MSHVLNWYAGWSFVLTSFLIGAALGLFFTRDDFLGGYTSWRRRLLRLGHVALAALGLFNIVYGIAPLPAPASWQAAGGSMGLVIGAPPCPPCAS